MEYKNKRGSKKYQHVIIARWSVLTQPFPTFFPFPPKGIPGSKKHPDPINIKLSQRSRTERIHVGVFFALLERHSIALLENTEKSNHSLDMLSDHWHQLLGPLKAQGIGFRIEIGQISKLFRSIAQMVLKNAFYISTLLAKDIDYHEREAETSSLQLHCCTNNNSHRKYVESNAKFHLKCVDILQSFYRHSYILQRNRYL